MKDIKSMLSAFSRAQKEGKKTALATLIQSEGISNHHQHTRILIGEDGQFSGAFSGRLEGAALAKIQTVMKQHRNKLVTLGPADQGTSRLLAKWGRGATIRLLVEPVLTYKIYNPIELLRQISGGKQDAVLVSLFAQDHDHHPGTSLLYRPDLLQSTLPLALQSSVLRDAQDALLTKSSSLRQYLCGGGRCNAWIEFIPQHAAPVVTESNTDNYPMIQIGSSPFLYPAFPV